MTKGRTGMEALGDGLSRGGGRTRVGGAQINRYRDATRGGGNVVGAGGGGG